MTTICFISLTQFDLLGRVVREFTNLATGQVTLHREELMGGVNFVELRAEDEVVGWGKVVEV